MYSDSRCSAPTANSWRSSDRRNFVATGTKGEDLFPCLLARLAAVARGREPCDGFARRAFGRTGSLAKSSSTEAFLGEAAKWGALPRDSSLISWRLIVTLLFPISAESSHGVAHFGLGLAGCGAT